MKIALSSKPACTTAAASLLVTTAALSPSSRGNNPILQGKFLGMPSIKPFEPTTSCSTDSIAKELNDVKKSPPNPSRSMVPSAEAQESIILPSMTAVFCGPGRPNMELWSKISPKALRKHRHSGLEMKMEWNTLSDDTYTIAKQVIQKISKWFVWNKKDKSSEMAVLDIYGSMAAFEKFCNQHLKNDCIAGYTIKVAVMRGASATRCPAWHTDHVPVRWIQTFFGPGSNYLDPRQAATNPLIQRVLQENKTVEVSANNNYAHWKERLVSDSGIQVRQVPTGDAVMFVGKTWNDWAKPEFCDNREGVLHRSPMDVPKDQGRVLLVLDVVMEEPSASSSSSICKKGCCGKD